LHEAFLVVPVEKKRNSLMKKNATVKLTEKSKNNGNSETSGFGNIRSPSLA